MKYKVGDKVLLRNDLVDGEVYGINSFVNGMLKGQVVTIIEIVHHSGYHIKEGGYFYTDEMIVGLANENTFKKEYLKAGMVIEVKNGGGKTCLAMICDSKSFGLCISGDNTFFTLKDVKDGLTYSDGYSTATITKIYDLPYTAFNAHVISTDNRKLLWELKEEDTKRKENIKKKNEMLKQREQLIKQVNDLETQIDIIEESYKEFMNENFKDDSVYYIPDDFKQQVIIIGRDRISNGYKIRL